jgi:hypothetical protein
LSYDNTRERKLAESASFASCIARQQEKFLRAMFPPPETTRPEVTAVIWATYLGHLVTFLASQVGKEAAAGILKQVLAAHHGDDHRDH